MKRIKRKITCNRCGLSESRRSIVFGRGELPCDLLIIGEAPGVTEDMRGEAFVGQSGLLLDRMIQGSGLNKFRVFRTNTVLCRPTEGLKGENREPTPEEILLCSGNVYRIINAARAREVLLLGAVAKNTWAKSLPRYTTAIHPSALLRTGSESSPYYMTTLQTFRTIEERLSNEI